LSENIAKTGLRASVNGVSEFPTPERKRPSGGDAFQTKIFGKKMNPRCWV
jgi:hypothetical protein